MRLGIPRSGYGAEMSLSPTDLVREAEYGHSERTPAIALAGIFVVVSCAVVVVVAVAMLVYYLA